MLNLDNAERGQIAPDSNKVKILSPEDKRRVGASLHPLEGSELVTKLIIHVNNIKTITEPGGEYTCFCGKKGMTIMKKVQVSFL
jgi:hypothetical protein